MFKTYNVGDSLWQMNLFMAMQVHRNLSTLSYMSVPTVEDETEEELSQLPTPDSSSASTAVRRPAFCS